MSTTNAKVLDPHAPRTFRRGTTTIWAIFITALAIAVAVFMGTGLTGHGFLSAIAPICVVAPIVTFAVLGAYWPHVVVRDDAVTVRNSFATFRIPYAAIKQIAESRIGMFILLHSGGKVPVTAYTSGSGAKALGHKKMAAVLINAIEDKMSFPTNETDAEVTRTVEVVHIVVSVASVLLAAGVLWGAIATYR